MPFLDMTGAASLEETWRELAERDIVLAIASAKEPVRLMLDRTALTQQIGAGRLFPTVESAVEALTAFRGPLIAS
jgi:sulfate permease, SulP family